MYGFRKEHYPSLQQAAIEAVGRIYSAGLMFRNGKLGAGGNNVMADMAAQAFNVADLAMLASSNNTLENNLASVIAMRRDYRDQCDLGVDYATTDAILQKIYDEVQVIKSYGLIQFQEPCGVQTSPAKRPSP